MSGAKNDRMSCAAADRTFLKYIMEYAPKPKLKPGETRDHNSKYFKIVTQKDSYFDLECRSKYYNKYRAKFYAESGYPANNSISVMYIDANRDLLDAWEASKNCIGQRSHPTGMYIPDKAYINLFSGNVDDSHIEPVHQLQNVEDFEMVGKNTTVEYSQYSYENN